MNEAQIERMKDLPSTHLLGAGTALCAGCGGLEMLKEAYDILGENTIFVNAAGCMTLMSIYPFTPFRGSWLYTSIASAPAGAQGVRDALDVLKETGRISEEEDLQVVVLTGDGAASGIGLSSTSGAIDRDLDLSISVTTMRATAIPGSKLPRKHLTVHAQRPMQWRPDFPVRRKTCFPFGRPIVRLMWQRLSAASRWISPAKSKRPRN